MASTTNGIRNFFSAVGNAVKQNAASGGSSSGNSASGSNKVQADAQGNAPSGTKVGDIVSTKGGDYKVVDAGTQGASYNPSSGLWSVKVNSGGGSSGGGGYTPLGTYNDNNVSTDVRDKINALKDQYAYYQSIGDKNGMNQSHAAAEQLRKDYGYSGGTDGSQFLPFELEADKVPAMGLPTYNAQIGAVNTTYDAALKNALAQLESSYNQSRLAAEAALAKIPANYQAQANQAAIQAERNRAQYNEYAAYNGLNAGNGSQAHLAMNNQLQNNLTTIGVNQANAITEAQQKLVSLYTAYQDAIAEAVANNEYERAAALLQEYRTQAQSVVDVAQSQASLNMNVAGFNRDTNQYNYQKALQTAETLAAFGDFSGYKALGYSEDQINNMKYVWQIQNGIYR